VKLICRVVLCLCVSACGKAPTTPTTPASTTVSLSLSPATDFIKIKSTEKFTVTATQPNGTAQVVQGTWGSDAPAVATVASDGTALGVGSGDATIFADYGGARATRRVHVAPDYNGTWSAAYRVMSCFSDGNWRCASNIDITSLWQMDSVFQQDRLTMTGTVRPYTDLDAVPIGGTIDGSGHFKAKGSLKFTDAAGTPILFEIVDFDAVSTDNQQFSGQITFRQSSTNYQGSGSLVCELLGARPSVITAGVRTAGGSPSLQLRQVFPSAPLP
jgi:hypothetical protein